MIYLRVVKCELPPPSSFYRPPSPPRPFMPTPIPDTYGSPGPASPSNSYGLPADSYGPPIESATPAPVIHKHVYVHIPPPGKF